MATEKQILPAGTSVKIAEKGSKKYILTPLGSTAVNNPIVPTPSQVYTLTYTVETEVEFSFDDTLKDAQGRVFADYIGGRPTR